MVDRRQSRFFKRIKHSTVLCALVCLLGVSESAVAEEPVSDESPPVETPPEENRRLGYILLGTSCALGLGMAGAFWMIRRRRRDQALLDFEGFGASDESGFSPTRRTVEASGRKRKPSSESASISGEAVLEALGASVDFAPQQGREPKRECPKCSRTFPSTIVVCPYDSATLRPVRAKRSAKFRGRGNEKGRRNKRSRNKKNGLDRRACTGCERRYESGVDFCYHDGLPLMQDTTERAFDAPTFKACEICGWEGEADDPPLGVNDACPNDACPSEANTLVEIDPSDSTHVQPTIPMTICPTCREYGAPGKAFCPNDGDVFMPVVNMRSTEFPARGFGPRRKVCGECGAEHGGRATYCSNDGTRLIALN